MTEFINYPLHISSKKKDNDVWQVEKNLIKKNIF